MFDVDLIPFFKFVFSGITIFVIAWVSNDNGGNQVKRWFSFCCYCFAVILWLWYGIASLNDDLDFVSPLKWFYLFMFGDSIIGFLLGVLVCLPYIVGVILVCFKKVEP